MKPPTVDAVSQKATGDTGSVKAVKVTDKPGDDYQSMTLSHFLVVVAKDSIAKSLGARINDWPMHHYWAMVSSVKSTVKDEQIPALMAAYNITKLSDYPPTRGNSL